MIYFPLEQCVSSWDLKTGIQEDWEFQITCNLIEFHLLELFHAGFSTAPEIRYWYKIKLIKRIMTPASSYSVIFFMLCCVALKCLWVDRECLQAPGWQAKPSVMLGTEKFFEKRHCVNTLLFSQSLPNKYKHKHKYKTKPTPGLFWSLFNRSIADL